MAAFVIRDDQFAVYGGAFVVWGDEAPPPAPPLPDPPELLTVNPSLVAGEIRARGRVGVIEARSRVGEIVERNTRGLI